MGTQKFRTLDVRPVLKNGGEPFSIITAEVAKLQPGEGLVLLTPFMPSPLIDYLKSSGFSASPQLSSDGTWQTIFKKS